MQLKMNKIFLLSILFFVQTNPSYAENNEPKQDANQSKEKSQGKDSFDTQDKKKIPPLPRHVLLPEVTYSRAPDITGEFTLSFSEHKIWILVIIASWNKRSAEIAKIFNQHEKEFKQRNIGVMALYSQDTEDNVDEWRKKNKPFFDNFFASRNFMDSLNNPKVPSIWLIGDKQEILLNYELPTIHQIDVVIDKSFILTGF